MSPRVDTSHSWFRPMHSIHTYVYIDFIIHILTCPFGFHMAGLLLPAQLMATTETVYAVLLVSSVLASVGREIGVMLMLYRVAMGTDAQVTINWSELMLFSDVVMFGALGGAKSDRMNCNRSLK